MLWSRWTLRRRCWPRSGIRRAPDRRPGGGRQDAARGGDERGGIDVIDVATGGAVGDRFRAHEGSVRCLSGVARPSGEVFLVSGARTAPYGSGRASAAASSTSSPGPAPCGPTTRSASPARTAR
ncbi:hypothetical protein NKH77_32580 [Streptomyces sp. M19]